MVLVEVCTLGTLSVLVQRHAAIMNSGSSLEGWGFHVEYDCGNDLGGRWIGELA